MIVIIGDDFPSLYYIPSNEVALNDVKSELDHATFHEL